MKLFLIGNNYHYEIEQLLRVFFPDIKLEKHFDEKHDETGNKIVCTSTTGSASVHIQVLIELEDFRKCAEADFFGDDLYKAGELGACSLLYKLLKEYTGYSPEWGMQTGVRPTKIFFNLRRALSENEALEYLENYLYISPLKAKLVQEVCHNEQRIISSAKEDEFSLYISIPFCPSRCSYCSFISHSIDSIKKLIPEYVRLLCREIEQIGKCTKELSLKLRTVYIGGGTPTVLSCEQLESIFSIIEKSFDLSSLSEYTLEAGRPDTLSEEKLRLIKNSRVTRLTINAQSFNDEVLSSIGRRHTAQDVLQAYQHARKLGFDNINTDLIAGLQGETVESFLDSLNKSVALGAENITIHTLALKRSSFLITRDNAKGKIAADTSEMIRQANHILRENGYIPYYMYRQSKSVGNLENTGWAKPGKICEYNIFMMEEVQNVFGAGAGAVTRLVNPSQRKIERVYNFKYPYEYIHDFNQIISRKNKAQKIVLNWLKS